MLDGVGVTGVATTGDDFKSPGCKETLEIGGPVGCARLGRGAGWHMPQGIQQCVLLVFAGSMLAGEGVGRCMWLGGDTVKDLV
jgi:hypothetical protein